MTNFCTWINEGMKFIRMTIIRIEDLFSFLILLKLT
jgi:hypothetical protein